MTKGRLHCVNHPAVHINKNAMGHDQKGGEYLENFLISIV